MTVTHRDRIASRSPARPRRPAPDPWVTFLIRRLVRLAISVWALVTFSFLIIHLIPGDPVRAALGITADPATVARQMRHDLGLDHPLITQYVHYIGNLLHRDLGDLAGQPAAGIDGHRRSGRPTR